MRILPWLLGAAVFVPCAAQAAPDAAQSVLASSFAAMGGRARLAALRSVEYTAVGTRAMVEQSERPSGPYFLDHFREHEIRDLTRPRSRLDDTDEAYAGPRWWTQQQDQTPGTVVVDDDVAATLAGGKYAYAGGYYIQQEEEQFAFAPERLLLTAEAAPDLHAAPDVQLHGVTHHVLAFTWKGAPCELTLSAATSLPWQIRWTRAYPYQTFLNVWGDVTSTVTYNSWSLEPNGVVYPREWTSERVGLPDRQLAIVRLAFDAPYDSASLDVPADIFAAHHGKVRRTADAPLGFGGSAAHELAPGILELGGAWNVAVVKQDDGLVVIEAPWSPQYSQRAFDEAKRRYGMPVKAVVTTSDSWPHLAGVRQAVADGIPVYALDLNEPILRRLLDAPHTQLPDDLASHPAAAQFRFVSAPTPVGSGTNRFTIVPYRSATGERQMMVYFPEHRLLYTSDLFAPDGEGGWFTPEYLREMLAAVEREHLDVRDIFGMHYDLTPLATVQDYLARFAPA